MNNIALRVDHLTKEYRLGTIGYGTLREDLQSWWARVRGKEDPNSLVTAIHHSDSEQKHFLALDDISFEVRKGDRLGIIGRNGAGKSTLLKILSRITSPTKGSIYLNGRVGSLLEVGTGFHQELTGRENIYLNGAILGMKRWEIDKKLDEIVDFAGVERFIDTPVKRYSSGMFVRLGFAVAAHLEPDILIVDEVLAVGDAEFQKKAIGKMEEVSNNQGRTILFVSHNMGSVRNLCNKGLLLDQGKLCYAGQIENVIDKYSRPESLFTVYYKRDAIVKKNVSILEAWAETSSHEKISMFENDQSVMLCCIFGVSKLEVSGLAISCEVYDVNGICVFCTTSRDTELSTIDRLEVGKYKYSFELPIGIMRGGVYSITLYAVIPNQALLDSAESCFKFEIFDIKSPIAKTGEGRRGVVLPIIQWEKIKIEDSSSYDYENKKRR